MARRPRLAAQAAAASLRTPVPKLSDNEDEDMGDAPDNDAPTPQDEDEEDEEDNVTADGEDEDNEQEDAPTPSRSDRISRSGTPRKRGRPSGLTARLRRGRPTPKRNDSEENANEGASDTVTPRRRGGFRGHRGGRWGKPRGPTRNAQAPVDDEGNVLNIVDDETELPEDLDGEKKVDKNGYLKGGREYRVRTFTIFGRDERLYMLSTEPARCIGFRDSYLFFQKHKHLYKIIIDDDEKRDLIDRDLIPHSYKGRAIGVVTARSVFREFGAKIIIGGRKIRDDYDVKGAQERGDVEGEVAVPEDRLPALGEPYNRNQYVAWHGASAVYHTGAPSVPLPSGKVAEAKRRKITVTSDNWMLEHAREASRFNALLALSRKDNERGIYDIHTNMMQKPAELQPTHAHWVGAVTTNDDVFEPLKLKPLPDIYARNFRIHDLFLESAPTSAYPALRPGREAYNLTSIAPHIIDELPEDCRQALQEEQAHQISWRNKWQSESDHGHRARITGSMDWFPKQG